MRMIMRVTLPPEIPALATPDFALKWQLLLKRIGALSADAREQGRLHFVMLDVEPGQITPIAQAVFQLTGTRPDFLPQIVPQPYYGLRN
jgi:hypothetical protein